MPAAQSAYVTSYAGAFCCGAQDAGGAPAGQLKAPESDQVATLIAPGGDFGQAVEEAGVSHYGAHFRGRWPAAGAKPSRRIAPAGTGGPGSSSSVAARFDPTRDAPGQAQGRSRTHERCIAHESQEQWRANLQTSTAANALGTREVQRGIRSTLRARGRSREEHEQRWRTWQKRCREGQQQLGVSEAGVSDASTMPAGQRKAKCLTDDYIGGIRIPFFGEDCPAPSWTTLATAPWAARRREAQAPPRAKAPPWMPQEEDEPGQLDQTQEWQMPVTPLRPGTGLPPISRPASIAPGGLAGEEPAVLRALEFGKVTTPR